LEQVRALVKYATGGLVPDLTVLLDVDVEEGLRRKKKDNEWNRLDAYTVEFHQRVRAGYVEMVRAEPNRWVVIDAGRKWEEVQEELRMVILGRLKTKA
jgi:dTMP kinase